MKVEGPKSAVTQANVSANAESAAAARPGARVEPCEFETLLRRAMEILDARAREATSPSR